MAIACNARKRLDLQGNDAEHVAIPLCWADSGLTMSGEMTLEIFERGAIGQSSGCVMKNGPPELCVAISGGVCEGICEVCNPDYEFIPTHYETNGDPYCRWIVRKKGLRGDVEDLGKHVKRSAKLDLPQDEMLFLRSHACGETWIWTTKGFLEIFGYEKTLDLLKPHMRELGHTNGKWLLDKLNLTQGDVRDLQRAISVIQDALGQKGDFTEIDDEIHGQVQNCPFKDAPKALCKQFEMMMDGVCKALDPDVNFCYTKMMTDGSKECAWVMSKRGMKRGLSAIASQKSESEEMMRHLKWRLVKGEITKDEYEELKEMISK